MQVDRAIRSRRVITPQGEHPAAVLVGGGKIVDIVDWEVVPVSVPIDDHGELAILPGLVDVHVHCNEPGRTEWEGFETATKSAIAGGVTTIVDMPLNSSPVTTTAAAFREKLNAASGKLWCDVGFWGGVVPGNLSDIDDLIAAGVLGFKAFLCHSGIDDFPNATEADLRAAMPKLARAGLPLLAHCELVSPHDPPAGDPTRYQTWLESRPAQYEQDAVRLMIGLCESTGCRVHIVHLSDAGCEALVRDARQRMPNRFTVETCPHYLHFSAELIGDGCTEFKCAPPIRSRINRGYLWRMLQAGEIQIIGSDHSPCPPSMKQLDTGNFMTAWGGIASLQLGLSIIWNAGQPRGASLSDVANWMSTQPAEFAGLSATKDAIAAGRDADLAVFDAEQYWVVEAERLFHLHKVTPYALECLHGKVEATYLRGERVFESGATSTQPRGRTILRTAS